MSCLPFFALQAYGWKTFVNIIWHLPEKFKRPLVVVLLSWFWSTIWSLRIQPLCVWKLEMPFRVPVGCDKLFGGMFFWKWFTSSGCGISLQLLDFLLTSNMKIKRLSSYLCHVKNLMQEVLRSFMLEFGVGIQSSSAHKYLWRRKAKVEPTVLCLNQPIPLHAAMQMRVWWQIIPFHLIAVGQCILPVSSMNWNGYTIRWLV